MSHGIDIGRKLSGDEADFLVRRGFTFVARYIDGTLGQSAKSLDSREVARLLGRGLGIVPVFEVSGAGPWTEAQGQSEGTAARGDLEALGYPVYLPVPFAVDTDLPDLSTLVPYFNGVFETIGDEYLAGVYGKRAVCQFARENLPGLGFFWLTYAWSGGLDYAPADVYQHANGVTLRAGLTVDLNIARSTIVWRLA